MEYGTVTGRLRRASPFDFELAKKAVRLNGATILAITKLDVLYPEIKGSTNFSDLPQEVLNFLEKLEDICKIPVKYISTGPAADEVIIKPDM